MKFSRLLGNPVLVMFIAVAFMFFATGCTKSVTVHDKDGKPSTVQETDYMATLAGVILFMIFLGALAVSTSGGSFLHEGKSSLVYVEDKDIASDALPDMVVQERWIRIIDSKGNLISEHLIEPGRLQFGEKIISLPDVRHSTKINEKVLEDFVRGIAKANNITSLPDSIKADVSWLLDEQDVLKINTVSIPQSKADSGGGISELVVATAHGFYSVKTVADRQSGHINVTVSQLDSSNRKEPARNFSY